MSSTKLRQKLFLVLFGLAITFLLLELGLRLYGHIYYSYKIKKGIIRTDDKNTIKILCVGDSFTFGHGAKKGYSYPEQLERILNNNNPTHKFIVYNLGICGENSSQLVKRLPGYLEEYNPGILIVLTGLNNSWNLDSNYFLFKEFSIKTFIYRVDAFLTRLRSYKLLKIGIENLKIISTGKSPVSYGSINKAQINKDVFNESKRRFELGKSYWDIRDINSAIKEFQKAIEINPIFYEAYLYLGYAYDAHGYFDLAVATFKKAIELDPNCIEAHKELWNAYWKTDNYKLALREAQEVLNLDPNNELLRKILKYGLPNRKDEALFNRLFSYDLQNIIKLGRAKGVKVILLNYPFYDSYDKTRKEIGDRYQIPFVDNAEAFVNLAQADNYSRKQYFREDDSHCNNNGYQVIAENVYRKLKSEVLELE